ncbi:MULTISPECIES: endonuclease/exonuclease/phosphatase family protein [unclassified Streptomyces]|uniref:endonuclease/exonuclease/phosphatase family protein n=1 Tax=unclassified Streptomyces TaxID=2593676 RepID=UPI0023657355|nr:MULTISPECIES: endonuclease/exonuclease/phosphatase family protein [unclassified Streptomyces]MDF3140979.1 endonuclease/exonuclease/phosphatase family protein [Streptomyces sp. T21Q-yed]WDF43628.1 endonuclease/exonuclease/phosphatase family protein [Streptomyces sp. T12]
MDASTVDVAVWNIEADGGRNGERRDLALDILAEYNPDVVLQQEAKYSRERGGRLMHATEKRLKLRGFLAAPNPYVDADIATAVYLRAEMFHIAEQKPHAKPWWLHPCRVQAQLGDCPVPLNFASFHMCYYDADQRLTEAGWLTTLAETGMATIAAGDTNSYPRRAEPVALPNWEMVTDRAHMVQRTYLGADGTRRSDTRPDGVLIDAGYVDLAHHAADHLSGLGNGALAATAGFSKPDQGGPQRVDRGYAVGGVASALEHVDVVDTKDTREASDHALLLYRFHRTRLERVLTQGRYALCAG